MHAYVPLLSSLLLHKWVTLRHPSAEPASIPLLSALLNKQVGPPIQPSAINTPPLPKISAFSIQLYVPPLQPSAVRAAPPPPQLSIFLQGQGKTPLLSSTMCDYVPLVSALLIRQGLPLFRTSDEPDTLPHLSAYFFQQDVLLLQHIAVHTHPPLPQP